MIFDRKVSSFLLKFLLYCFILLSYSLCYIFNPASHSLRPAEVFDVLFLGLGGCTLKKRCSYKLKTRQRKPLWSWGLIISYWYSCNPMTRTLEPLVYSWFFAVELDVITHLYGLIANLVIQSDMKPIGTSLTLIYAEILQQRNHAKNRLIVQKFKRVITTKNFARTRNES